MPRVFQWSAPVYQADLDAFGELRSAALLRLLQETATRASTAAGYPPAYYDDTGSMWIVRRTTLTLLEPILYGATLALRTWIADFRRVRSQRKYEVRVGDALVARAHTDWVLVDGRGRPRRIPKELQNVFMPEGPITLTRAPFPALTPPATALRTSRQIQWHELDGLQHVNNANYASFIEQGCHDAVARAGWSLPAQLAEGVRFRAMAHDLEYLEAALYGDVLDVISWPIEQGATTLGRATLIARNQTSRPLLRAISRYAWVAIANGDPRPLPDSLRPDAAGRCRDATTI